MPYNHTNYHSNSMDKLVYELFCSQNWSPVAQATETPVLTHHVHNKTHFMSFNSLYKFCQYSTCQTFKFEKQLGAS